MPRHIPCTAFSDHCESIGRFGGSFAPVPYTYFLSLCIHVRERVSVILDLGLFYNLEERHIVVQELGEVDVDDGAQQQDLLLLRGVLELEVAGGSEDALHGSHTVVIVGLPEHGTISEADLRYKVISLGL